MNYLIGYHRLWIGLALLFAALGSCAETFAAVDTVTVNGRTVEVVDQDFVIPIQYARFSSNGKAVVEITHSRPVEAFVISPKRRNLPATSDGNKLTLTLENWGYWSLKINNDIFLLFVDPSESHVPLPNASEVHNVVTWSVCFFSMSPKRGKTISMAPPWGAATSKA